MWPPTELLCLLSAMVFLGAVGTFGDTATQSAEMPTSTLGTEIAETEDKFETMTKELRRLAARRLLPIASEIMSDPRFSPRCAGAFFKLRGAIRENEMWVLQMLDSFGRPPAGMMSGRLADYGAYDQCLAVRHPQNAFQGKYCLIHVRGIGKITPRFQELSNKYLEHINFKYVGNLSDLREATEIGEVMPFFKLGSCIPSSCRKEDLQVILDIVLTKYGLRINVPWCKVQEPVPLDRRQIAIICIFGGWLCFIAIGTTYDLCQSMGSKNESEYPEKPQTPGVLSTLVLGFSLRRAILKLTQMPNWGDYSNELGFVHGMRVLSATWVVLGHSLVVRDIHHNSDFIGLLRKMQKDIFFCVQMQSFMAVGSFFVITGFLSGYLVVKAPKAKFNVYLLVLFAFIRRYIRLVPSMLAVLGAMYMIPLLVSGPLLEDMWSFFERPCTKHWWKILTMTHNFPDDITDFCMPHYWYISVDFQLAIVSTIILAAVTPRWPKMGLVIMAAIVITTSVATGVVTYVNKYLPYLFILTTSIRRITNTAMHVYISPYVNAPSLFTAIIFGCLAAKPHKLSRTVQAFMWALSVALGIASVFTIFTWHSGRHPEPLETAFYAGSHRFAWAFGVSWVMYACATGRGGPVNKILANPLFYPLGRLSYALYLVHLLVLACNAILNRDRRTYQPFLQGQEYIGATITSYAFATFVYLLVECPIAVIDNLMFSGMKAKYDAEIASSQQSQEMQTINITNGAPPRNFISSGGQHQNEYHKENNPGKAAKDYVDFRYENQKNYSNMHQNGGFENDRDENVINRNDEIVKVKF
ncbi:unnamed protein product [Ixodes pacificus]